MIDVEVESQELDNFLTNFNKKIKSINTEILNEIAGFTLERMQYYYSSAEVEPGESMSFIKTDEKDGVTCSMVGPQSWYTEFGTGTKGQQHKHPLKSKFKSEYGLHEYNSGKTIRRATEKVAENQKAIEAGITPGTLYWTYKGKDGDINYTTGIPSQRIVYNAGKEAKKELRVVIKRHMEKGLNK